MSIPPSLFYTNNLIDIILDNGKMVWDMEKESKFGKMEVYI